MEEKKQQPLQFGETIKLIAEKIGMRFLEKIPETPRELIESIPFPHKCIIRQYVKHVRQHQSELESIIQQAAKFYGVDGEILLERSSRIQRKQEK